MPGPARVSASPPSDAPPHGGPGPAPGPLRLLYVDDDQGLCRLVARRLAREGVSVEVAHDGDGALERLARGGIDAIGLDHQLAGEDGLSVLARLRDLPGAPPVVYCTGAQEASVAVGAFRAGAADYVVKDVGGEFVGLLKRAAEQAVETARLRAAAADAQAAIARARDDAQALADERAMLLREVNHRVGNSLQLIASVLHMQAGASGDPDVKAALTSANGRVLAVAQVHRRLYTSDDVRRVALDQYLSGLVDDLRRSAQEGHHELTFEAVPVEVDPDRAVAIGVVVTELVINAIKYAYPVDHGPIEVRLAAQGAQATLSVQDSGIGRATADASPSDRRGGLGSVIVRAMASKLGAALRYEPVAVGTRAVLAFTAEVEAPKPAMAPP